MNPYLLGSGLMLICFANREAGAITFKRARIGVSYSFFGVLLFGSGLILS